MQCPRCPAVTLAMSDRQGIEIDYCPQCRGLWLDRGELDKLLEREAATLSSSAPDARRPVYEDVRHGAHDGHDPARRGHHGGDRHGGRHPRKRGLLSHLLDF